MPITRDPIGIGPPYLVTTTADSWREEHRFSMRVVAPGRRGSAGHDTGSTEGAPMMVTARCQPATERTTIASLPDRDVLVERGWS